MAHAYLALPVYGGGSYRDLHAKAKAAAQRALELDETRAEAHAALGNALYFYDWNLPASSRELQTAIALNPNYATAHQSYGERNLYLMGRFEEAHAHLKRAQELDPLSLIINADLGAHYVKTGQPDKAIEQLRKTLELDQNFYGAYRWLGEAYQLRGAFPEALAAYEKAYQLNDAPVVLALMGHLYTVSGRKTEALSKLAQLKELAKRRYVSEHDFAIIYAGLGDKEQALHWLERGYQAHLPHMLRLKLDPQFVNLRSDPRFIDLVRRVGVAP